MASGYPPYDPSRYAPPPGAATYGYAPNGYAGKGTIHGAKDLRKTPYYYYSDDDTDSSDDDDRLDRRAKSRGRSRSRSRRRRSDSIPRGRSRAPPSERYTIAKAAKSAAMAAAVEAVRCRKEPGDWSGQKGKRIAIAAGSGVVIGAFRNGRLQKNGKLPLAEAAVSGFYAVDFLKRVLRHTEFGEKDAEEDEDDREDRDHRKYSRSRSRSHRRYSS